MYDNVERQLTDYIFNIFFAARLVRLWIHCFSKKKHFSSMYILTSYTPQSRSSEQIIRHRMRPNYCLFETGDRTQQCNDWLLCCHFADRTNFSTFCPKNPELFPANFQHRKKETKMIAAKMQIFADNTNRKTFPLIFCFLPTFLWPIRDLT